MQITEILKDSNYHLSQFDQVTIDSLQATIFAKETKKGAVPYIKCLIRAKDIKLTPEEIVRQLYLKQLLEHYNYPTERIQVEYGVKFGTETKRADIVIFDKDRPEVPYIIIELKKPKLKDGKDQLKSYCNATGSPMGIWTNGEQISYYHRKDPNYFEDITDIPAVDQTLADILNERFTWEDLVKKDKLVNQNKTLRAIIEEMEDEVLANAGVDVFEEAFKLLFAKLYDEWLSGRDEQSKANRLLEFRNTGQTETELKDKIQDLFDRAKDKWPGVFNEDSKIILSPSHLSVCIGSLENVKLFNSNLDVVDEAFEYLIGKTSKGEKGQYFTPRYIIDMCVKMLNPQEDETLIDTAAGSAGFTVHGIFHVWEQIMRDEGLEVGNLFTVERKPYRCTKYVEDKVFAIDFDEKAVRVARTLNLIAGDGQTNVLHLNTLDYERWDEWFKAEEWIDVYNDGFKKLKKLCVGNGKKGFKQFQFDVLMANPPFAGDIKETRMLAKYELGKKPNGKLQNKLGRDVLFIERNLDFLKPGGRMAVVLPQGRFNNSSDKSIRDFIAERCRILAVVGLHGNTFKPHTGTKTSVLLVQKWNDDAKIGSLCPKVDDYNIFFATMRLSGKDNSGEKIFHSELDRHGHKMVVHDLFNHDGLTEDGIAEAFVEFAKKEGLSFFDQSSSVVPFDKVKYQRLMDGLEAVELKMNTVITNNLSFRIDSEFFQKNYISIAQKIKRKKIMSLHELTHKIDVGYVGSMVSQYVDDGIDLIQTKNIDVFFTNTNDCIKINLKFHNQLQKSQVNYKNILIARSGSFGKASIYLSDKVVNSSDIIIINCNSYINPFYLTTFLNSNFGTMQLYRFASGGLQGHVNLTILENLQVPLLNNDFQKLIEKVIVRSYELRKLSAHIYVKAETHLLEALGLKDWQAPDDNISVKSFSSSFGTSGRLDAEFYQPKYENIEKHIKNYEHGYITLGAALEEIDTGEYTDKYENKSLNTKFYIRNTNIRNGDIDESSEGYYVNPQEFSRFVKTGDILTSRVGTIGLFGVVPKNLTGCIFSDNVLRLRLPKKEYIPNVYALYFNSLPNQELMSRISGGSVQPLITQTTLKSIIIPKFNINLQKKVETKINSSFEMKQQSQHLLTIAKIAVEKAIETDETTATKWLEGKMRNII